MTKRVNREKFWMVWSPQGRAPSYKHPSRDLADREASRLAETNPGREFFVMKAVGGATGQAKLRAIKMTDQPGRDDEIPF